MKDSCSMILILKIEVECCRLPPHCSMFSIARCILRVLFNDCIFCYMHDAECKLHVIFFKFCWMIILDVYFVPTMLNVNICTIECKNICIYTRNGWNYTYGVILLGIVNENCKVNFFRTKLSFRGNRFWTSVETLIESERNKLSVQGHRGTILTTLVRLPPLFFLFCVFQQTLHEYLAIQFS